MPSIQGFCGGVGSGKTLRMTMKLKEFYDKGYDILANYDLGFKFKKINPLDLINGLYDDSLDNSAIGLTEAYTFIDSRYSGSEANRYIGYFVLQTRKRDINFLYDAQMLGSVENRVRGVTTKVYECEKILIDYTDETRTEDITNIIGFKFKVHEINRSYNEALDIKDAIKIFDLNLYNTKDILLPYYMSPTIDFDNLIECFKDSPNRETFMILIKLKNPFIGYDKSKALYSLLKADKIDLVKEVLRIKDN